MSWPFHLPSLVSQIVTILQNKQKRTISSITLPYVDYQPHWPLISEAYLNSYNFYHINQPSILRCVIHWQHSPICLNNLDFLISLCRQGAFWWQTLCPILLCSPQHTENAHSYNWGLKNAGPHFSPIFGPIDIYQYIVLQNQTLKNKNILLHGLKRTEFKLIPQMYKQLMQLNTRKANNPVKMWKKNLNRNFSKEDIKTANKHM